MANNITVNPWILDTAVSASALMMKRVTVTAIRWDAASAVSGNTAVLSDKNGNTVWDSIVYLTGVAPLNNPMVFPDGGFTFDGLGIPTLANGKVYVYVKNFGT